MSETTAAAITIQAKALAGALRGGAVLVKDGEKILVRCAFPDGFELADPSTFVFKDLPASTVEEMGSPTAFDAVTKDGEVLIRGTVGKRRTPGSLEKKDMVLEDHEKLYRGMKFSLAEFRHRIKVI